MNDRDPKERFSCRVANYVKYRPSYPAAAIEVLRTDCGLKPGADVADIGSGTGILTTLLIKAGATVYAIEPNAGMRGAAKQGITDSRFHSVDASAEHTTLPNASIDLITAGQAFHWFDQDGAKTEFKRVLKPGGWVALIWNDRASGGSPFMEQYEDLLHKFSPEYAEVCHRNLEAQQLAPFFKDSQMQTATMPYILPMNYEELEGRLLSSSYTPQEGELGHEAMLDRLKQIFEATAVNGKVEFVYETMVFYGQM
ncbi:MAG TPA: class I SAM-dependent methyltransferase [Fimbriimonadaceae bacterium]|jgi:ubiquinone/menaquinone biosynthesis C-methylase UbiE